MPAFIDKTQSGEWTLIVHRVSQTTVELWAGTLFPTLDMPERARVRVIDPDDDAPVEELEIRKRDWRRPFRAVNQRFYASWRVEGLRPDTRYEVSFARRIEAVPGIIAEQWQELRRACFRTLPEALPRARREAFSVALGSCFYDHRDGGQAAASYRALFERAPKAVQPNISLLTGDLVYLDVGIDSLSLRPKEARQRIANDYARHFQALGAVMNRGATWMLPDDHEYWNDYPYLDKRNPYLWALCVDSMRKAWTEAASDGVRKVMRTEKIERFSIGEDLSFCVADLRSHRSRREDLWFASKSTREALRDWAAELCGPGVLVLSQPLIVEPSDSERNLASFRANYLELVSALAHAGHDIVLLTGDVHFGRVASVALDDDGHRLIEVIASPLSNLTRINSLASAVAAEGRRPKYFPATELGPLPAGVERRAVDYDRAFEVSHRPGRALSAYHCDRTSEHWMTLGFHKDARGAVHLEVEAWRIRQRDGGRRNLPRRDFAAPYRTRLS